MNTNVNTDLSYQKWERRACWGLPRKTALQVRESAWERYQDALEARCPDAPPTDEDRKAVLKEMGSPFLFGAGFLPANHWTTHPGFAQVFRKYEFLFGIPCLIAGMAFLGTLYVDGAKTVDRFTFGVLFFISALWSGMSILSAGILMVPNATNGDFMEYLLQPRHFVTSNNGVTLRSKGLFYTLFKGVVVLAPLVVPSVIRAPQMYLFAAAAVLLLAVIAAERTVRMIHQRRKVTYLTRIGVDVLLVIAVSAIWLVGDAAAGYRYLFGLSMGYDDVVLGFAVAMLAVFYLYMLCDMLIALRRIRQCHQHSLRKTHPAIEKYLRICSPYTPGHIVDAVRERIEDLLREKGADPFYPDDEALIEVLDEMGSPDEIFGSYVSRGLISRDFATMCIVYHSPWVHAAAVLLAFALAVWYTGGFGEHFVEILLEAWLMIVSLVQYGSTAFFRKLSSGLRFWKD